MLNRQPFDNLIHSILKESFFKETFRSAFKKKILEIQNNTSIDFLNIVYCLLWYYYLYICVNNAKIVFTLSIYITIVKLITVNVYVNLSQIPINITFVLSFFVLNKTRGFIYSSGLLIYFNNYESNY